MNVGTLHARVTYTGPSLDSKYHSHELSVIPGIPSSREDTIFHKWMLNLVSIFRHTWPLSYWSFTIIRHRWQSYHHSPFFERIHIINLLPLCLRRVHIFDLFFLSEESPCIRLVPPFRRGSISSSFLLIREVCSPIIVPPCEESLFELHQDFHGNIQTSLEIEAWSVHQQLSYQYSHTGDL